MNLEHVPDVLYQKISSAPFAKFCLKTGNYAPKFAQCAFWHFLNFLPIMLVLCFLDMHYAENAYI